MPVIISDETLETAHLTEREARIEIACHLFDKGKLHLWPAAQLAEMTRGEFESELIGRGIALHRVDDAYIQHELEYARQFGPGRSKS